MHQFSHEVSANSFGRSQFAPLFFPARVMSPAQVAAAVADGPEEVKKRTVGKWHLCGDVSAEMFAVLSAVVRSETAMRISAFTAPSGAAYGVVSHQVHGFAHRFLLPLYESSVTDMLAGLRSGQELGFMLGREGNVEALLVEPPQGSLSGFAPLLAMSGSVNTDRVGETISELSSVIKALLDPTQIPTARSGEPVLSVDVSAVMPTRTLQALLAQSGERK